MYKVYKFDLDRIRTSMLSSDNVEQASDPLDDPKVQKRILKLFAYIHAYDNDDHTNKCTIISSNQDQKNKFIKALNELSPGWEFYNSPRFEEVLDNDENELRLVEESPLIVNIQSITQINKMNFSIRMNSIKDLICNAILGLVCMCLLPINIPLYFVSKIINEVYEVTDHISKDTPSFQPFAFLIAGLGIALCSALSVWFGITIISGILIPLFAPVTLGISWAVFLTGVTCGALCAAAFSYPFFKKAAISAYNLFPKNEDSHENSRLSFINSCGKIMKRLCGKVTHPFGSTSIKTASEENLIKHQEPSSCSLSLFSIFCKKRTRINHNEKTPLLTPSHMQRISQPV